MSNQSRKLRLKVSHDPLDISSVRCHGMSASQLLALPNYCGENGLFLHNHTVQMHPFFGLSHMNFPKSLCMFGGK